MKEVNEIPSIVLIGFVLVGFGCIYVCQDHSLRLYSSNITSLVD